jgi:hypothetical protein
MNQRIAPSTRAAEIFRLQQIARHQLGRQSFQVFRAAGFSCQQPQLRPRCVQRLGNMAPDKSSGSG